ncbi:ZIP Zinc transporter [Halpernia humi]|uniref:ZIP Zinc transporter n=1 Tax=Halpernia humi TaxID=493375 RepID=A0A1H5YN08_9FLAO|nr:ZIP family metal transporter [Halpernia humi]SEG25140.1 ZIP Zinc transporter [Halpernia humi]
MVQIFIFILLLMSVLAGVFLGKYFGKQEKLAKNLLILSAGFLITICLNEVFPEVYAAENHAIGLWIIGGVLLQMILESLTKGFEHGHFHSHGDQAILPVALMIGLFFHAFLEGIPLASEREIFSPYLMGILFHNLPISFVLGAFLIKNKASFSAKSWLIILIFAMASPVGMFLGHYFNPNLKIYFLAIVGGIFLHISSVIIFESNKNHNIDWMKIILVVCGVLLALSGHLFH